eukprot:TRINITY_DN20037_c0_g1_i1.p2 TRINITY_DN20037_c0_g1~~TRINITY_DN20037_c0_g1_i1.p2  ORF type:complete len:124 (+),score=34.32 TRINITY_DN20037_c0_g1_i1:97-468(+)
MAADLPTLVAAEAHMRKTATDLAAVSQGKDSRIFNVIARIGADAHNYLNSFLTTAEPDQKWETYRSFQATQKSWMMKLHLLQRDLQAGILVRDGTDAPRSAAASEASSEDSAWRSFSVDLDAA